MRISGFTRAEMRYVEPVDQVQDRIGFRSRNRINFDVRTRTEYGVLRGFIGHEFRRASGSFTTLFADEGDELGQPIGGEIDLDHEVDRAFVQFAGFTAGRTQSFYDFYTNDLNFEDVRGSDKKLQVFAYTATFGEGWSTTVSLEDPFERRFTGAPFGGFPVINGGPGSQNLAFATARMPDVVANIRTEQDWGDAQLSGAVHQLRSINFFPGFESPTGIGVLGGGFADTEYGFAAQAGVRFKLPFLAEGDEIWLQAGYAHGAVDYLALAEYTQIGGVLVNGVDGFVDQSGKVRLSTGFSLSSALVHYWTPKIRQGVFGSYARLAFSDVGQASVIDPVFGPVNVGFVDFDEWRIGSNLIWSPVKRLDIGVEALYIMLDPEGRVRSAPIYRTATGFEQRSIDADDVWIGRLRFQVEF
jgi:hypothetical protein